MKVHTEDDNKESASQKSCREQSWRCERAEGEEEEEGARGAWPMGGAEDVRDGLRDGTCGQAEEKTDADRADGFSNIGAEKKE